MNYYDRYLTDLDRSMLAVLYIVDKQGYEKQWLGHAAMLRRLHKLGLLWIVDVKESDSSGNEYCKYQVTKGGNRLVEFWDPLFVTELLLARGFEPMASPFISRLRFEELPPYIAHSNMFVRDAALLRYCILTKNCMVCVFRWVRRRWRILTANRQLRILILM